MYGRELIAVDGTCIKAVNNRERNFTQANQMGQGTFLIRRLEVRGEFSLTALAYNLRRAINLARILHEQCKVEPFFGAERPTKIPASVWG